MKKIYLKPNTEWLHVRCTQLLAGSGNVPVDPSQQGDQADADSRSYRHRTVWDDDEEEE